MTVRLCLCLWCNQPFEPRRGGSRQRFCCPTHRSEFHTAARLWAEKAVAEGRLSTADLQKGTGEPFTLLSRGPAAVPLPEIGQADLALLTALRRRGRMVLQLPIAPEGIAELVRLGWLPRHCFPDPATVGDAISELADAALDARLRPG
jgi:hypothetical protein